MGHFLIGVFVGFWIGLIFTSIALAKKNLERMEKIQDGVFDTVDQMKSTYKQFAEDSETENTDETSAETDDE